MKEEKKKVFVIMPSGNNGEYLDGNEEADFIYHDIIHKALKQVFDDHIIIEREIDNRKSGAIDRNIVRKIAESDYAIVDITGRNPNVFFELGLRYALCEKTTILIRQADTPIPFDIGTYRAITYKSKFNGVKEAIQDISEALNSAKDSMDTDSLVYNVYPNLNVVLDDKPIIIKGKEYDMPWDYFWNRFSFYLDLLDRHKDIFRPDYIVGISNGGLFLSDTIYRMLYSDQNIPIVSFWASRTEQNYFQNLFSINIINAVKEDLKRKENKKPTCKMLVFDDVVDTGKTIKEFKKFIKDNLPEAEIYYIPLFSRNKKLENIKKETIWVRDDFKIMFEHLEFPKHCYTEYNHLPYLKLINFKL